MAEAKQKAKKGRKNRKWGRNASYMLRYRNSNRREHNKLRRLKKRLVRHPNDLIAVAAVERCLSIIRGH